MYIYIYGWGCKHGGILAAPTLFTIVASEASTPPSRPLYTWSTELPLPMSKHVSRQG